MKCDGGDTLLMSNPPQHKCIYCGKHWIAGNTIPECEYSTPNKAIETNLKNYLKDK